MHTIRIATTQNIELEYELANVGERFLAWLIDLGIFLGYFFLISILSNFYSPRHFKNNHVLVVLLVILIISPFVFYNLLCEVWWNGQTAGKKVMKIKVVSLNGNQPTFGQYMLRWLFRLIDIYLFEALPAFICIIVSDKKQRIGDIVAGTAVIKTTPRTDLQQTLHVPTPEVNYQVSFPEIVHLPDRDMQLVKEVILSVQQTGNMMLASKTAEKIKQTPHIETNLEPLYFLQVLLSDYNHLTSRL